MMTMMMKNTKTTVTLIPNIKRKVGSSIGWDTNTDGLGGAVDEES